MLKENSQPLIEPWHPTPEQESAIRATDPTSAWLNNLPSDILRKYRDQWIAAKDCSLVASGQTMDELLTNLGDVDLGKVVLMCLKRPIQIYR